MAMDMRRLGGGHWLLRLLGVRLLTLAWLLPLAAVLSFTLMQVSPHDPVESYVGARTALIGTEQRARIAAELGLDAPAFQRFLIWAGNLARGDMGVSAIFRAPVADVIAERFRATITLLGLAFVISGALGFAMGLLAGGWAGSWADRAIRAFAMVLAASPGFWVAILLIALFAVTLGWLPACCAVPPGRLAAEVTFLDELRHLILPATALSVVGISPIILHTRQRQIEMMQAPPARLLLAHGATRASVAFGPGMRHAAGPALALHMAGMGELFGGAVLAETIFGWPGLGQATVQAVLQQDAPLLLGIVLFSVLFVFAGNLLADIARTSLDPRLRRRGRT